MTGATSGRTAILIETLALALVAFVLLLPVFRFMNLLSFGVPVVRAAVVVAAGTSIAVQCLLAVRRHWQRQRLLREHGVGRHSALHWR